MTLSFLVLDKSSDIIPVSYKVVLMTLKFGIVHDKYEVSLIIFTTVNVYYNFLQS